MLRHLLLFILFLLVIHSHLVGQQILLGKYCEKFPKGAVALESTCITFLKENRFEYENENSCMLTTYKGVGTYEIVQNKLILHFQRHTEDYDLKMEIDTIKALSDSIEYHFEIFDTNLLVFSKEPYYPNPIFFYYTIDYKQKKIIINKIPIELTIPFSFTVRLASDIIPQSIKAGILVDNIAFQYHYIPITDKESKKVKIHHLLKDGVSYLQAGKTMEFQLRRGMQGIKFKELKNPYFYVKQNNL